MSSIFKITLSLTEFSAVLSVKTALLKAVSKNSRSFFAGFEYFSTFRGGARMAIVDYEIIGGGGGGGDLW